MRDSPVKLSVMMITYNHESFIAQALNSILDQRVNFDYEIVIGEDFSTDRTREIVVDFQRKHPTRIKPLLRDKNMGAIKNMGATLSACRGNYVAFLEGDDYWVDEHKLQTQVDFLDNHPESAICCHRVRFLDPEEREGMDIHPSYPAGSYTVEDLLRQNFVPTCSAVIRRGLIGPLPSWHAQLAMGDWTLFALVSSKGAIELMDEVMAVYRVHEGGIWSSRSRVSRMREIARMLKVLDKHFKFKYTNTVRPVLAQHYLDLALMERQNGSRLGTGKYTLSCIRNGGRLLPQKQRILAGLGAYALMGSWYKLFSKAKYQGNRV